MAIELASIATKFQGKDALVVFLGTSATASRRMRRCGRVRRDIGPYSTAHLTVFTSMILKETLLTQIELLQTCLDIRGKRFLLSTFHHC